MDVDFLPRGIAGALMQHAFRYFCCSIMCYACLCFKLIFALVCSCLFLCSGYLVAGGDVVFFAMATWSLADAISFLRSGYLVAG